MAQSGKFGPGVGGKARVHGHVLATKGSDGQTGNVPVRPGHHRRGGLPKDKGAARGCYQRRPRLLRSGCPPRETNISQAEDVEQNALYLATVSIGTPAQNLKLDFDTGSADLWVPVNCTSCNGLSFDPAQSSTYTNTNQPFSITYVCPKLTSLSDDFFHDTFVVQGSGAVSGTLATDVLSIAGFIVQQQAFGAIDGESADFQGRPNDGLLGMAFGTIAQSRRPTFFENLIEERQLVAPLFSIHLERQKETGSEVRFIGTVVGWV